MTAGHCEPASVRSSDDSEVVGISCNEGVSSGGSLWLVEVSKKVRRGRRCGLDLFLTAGRGDGRCGFRGGILVEGLEGSDVDVGLGEQSVPDEGEEVGVAVLGGGATSGRGGVERVGRVEEALDEAGERLDRRPYAPRHRQLSRRQQKNPNRPRAGLARL